uniref:NADH dehydrogenase [ubiquinone] 1 alpha subcomplex subunit 2 n=1 Tax=Panagrellus redivivus TaxID=6233 RepID=A0A7E4ZSI2_PANRE
MASAIRLGAGALKELRIHLCQKSSASAGVRSFIENDYVQLKKANLDFPILVREAAGITPKIWARYSHGIEQSVPIENAPREKVLEVVKQLASQQPRA